MPKEERLQEILRAFVETLNSMAEGRHSREVHAATIARLLAEVRELKEAGSEMDAARRGASLVA